MSAPLLVRSLRWTLFCSATTAACSIAEVARRRPPLALLAIPMTVPLLISILVRRTRSILHANCRTSSPLPTVLRRHSPYVTAIVCQRRPLSAATVRRRPSSVSVAHSRHSIVHRPSYYTAIIRRHRRTPLSDSIAIIRHRSSSLAVHRRHRLPPSTAVLRHCIPSFVVRLHSHNRTPSSVIHYRHHPPPSSHAAVINHRHHPPPFTVTRRISSPSSATVVRCPPPPYTVVRLQRTPSSVGHCSYSSCTTWFIAFCHGLSSTGVVDNQPLFQNMIVFKYVDV